MTAAAAATSSRSTAVGVNSGGLAFRSHSNLGDDTIRQLT